MKFLKENWCKLMTGTAMLIFACGFFIYAVSPSYASYNGNSPSNNDYALVPLNKDGSINVKLSEEQLDEEGNIRVVTSGASSVWLAGWHTRYGYDRAFDQYSLPVE